MMLNIYQFTDMWVLLPWRHFLMFKESKSAYFQVIPIEKLIDKKLFLSIFFYHKIDLNDFNLIFLLLTRLLQNHIFLHFLQCPKCVGIFMNVSKCEKLGGSNCISNLPNLIKIVTWHILSSLKSKMEWNFWNFWNLLFYCQVLCSVVHCFQKLC